MNYLKCSNDFSADCRVEKSISISYDNFQITWERLEEKFSNQREQLFGSVKRFILVQLSYSLCCKLSAAVGSKIIRALAIVVAIFLWFDCQFLSTHACYQQYTVGSKIIRTLEIARVKKFISHAVLRNKYLSSHEL